jgi:mRNA interferase MazF
MLLPDAGDIVWVDFDPVRGTEQAGRRPALVLTSRSYHEVSNRSLVCPITRRVREWPSDVLLPAQMKTKGAVLIDQIRVVDRRHRMFGPVERVPGDVLARVRLHLAALLGIEVPIGSR